MRVGFLIATVLLCACSKTKDGDLEVEKPAIGTVTDTLFMEVGHLPPMPLDTAKKDSLTRDSSGATKR